MAMKDQMAAFLGFVTGSQKEIEHKAPYVYNANADRFKVCDNADRTKCVSFDASGATAGTPTVIGSGLGTVVTTTAATVAPAATASGTTYHATAGSGTQTFTLPAAAAGLRYTFIAGNASSEILITPATGDAINIMTFAAVGVDADTARVAPAAGTGIKNTAATNVVGDTVELVAVDGTTWYGIGVTAGIWASQ